MSDVRLGVGRVCPGCAQLQLDNFVEWDVRTMSERMTILGYWLEVELEMRPGHSVRFTTPYGIWDAGVWRFPGQWSIPGGASNGVSFPLPLFRGCSGSMLGIMAYPYPSPLKDQ